MEKEQVNTNAECPACHSLMDSTLHSSLCAGNEIAEVTPPERRKRQLRCGHEEVEPSAFPLVSAAHEFKTPLVVMLGIQTFCLTAIWAQSTRDRNKFWEKCSKAPSACKN